jgi:hypothetical protein
MNCTVNVAWVPTAKMRTTFQRAFFNHPDAFITNARAVFNGKLYPLARVTTVRRIVGRQTGFVTVILVLSTLGAIYCGFALLGELQRSEPAGIERSVIGLIVALVLRWMAKKYHDPRPPLIILFEDTDDEYPVFTTRDEELATSIYNALNEALRMR